MTFDIIQQRLHNQLLSQTNFTQPSQVVGWFGAVQAQDYAGAKWALGQRFKDAIDSAVEQAFTAGDVLRTHVLRPTWHFVLSADIRWMLELTAPRVRAAIAHMDRQLEVDRPTIKKSNSILAKTLRGNQQQTRAELAPILEQAGILVDGLRLGHLLMHAELDGAICSGGRKGKQFTYALLEERAPQAKVHPREEALAELTRRYFRGHGPASLQDFVWWSGLTMTDARLGIAAVKSEFESETLDNREYWFTASSSLKESAYSVHLLPAYDEYTVGYKDRSAIYDGSHTEKLKAFRESILTQTILIEGEISGTWRRTIKKKEVVMEVVPFSMLRKSQNQEVIAAAQRYGKFLGLPGVLGV